MCLTFHAMSHGAVESVPIRWQTSRTLYVDREGVVRLIQKTEQRICAPRSSEWGTQPLHWYFSSALPRGMLAALPLAAYGFWIEQRLRPLVCVTAAYVALYSLLPHKEVRSGSSSYAARMAPTCLLEIKTMFPRWPY